MQEQHDHIRQLVLEKLTGTISASDESRLHQLMEDEPAVRDLWESLHAQAGTLRLDEVLARADEEKALAALHSKLTPARPLHRSRIFVWSAAAAVVLAAIGGAWYYQQRLQTAAVVADAKPEKQGVKLLLGNGEEVLLADNGQQLAGSTMLQTKNKELHYTPGSGETVSLNTLVVPPKEDYKIVLSDGTEVRLNSASRLRFPFAFKGNTREVFLEGEAYFKVAQRSSQPFIVHTVHTDVRVLGTDFNINAYERKQLKASLVNGKIAVYAEGDSLKVQPGMEVLSDGNRLRIAAFDESSTLAWMEGLYYFSNVPLQQLSGILSRWFDIKVMFDEPATATAMVSGVLEKGKLADFLENLRVATGIRHRWKEGVLYLK